MFYVYILKCKDGSLYTGYTNNLKKRLKMHNLGKASKYTRARLPVEIICHRSFNSKSRAMKYEIKIKNMSKKLKLEEIALLQKNK